MAINPIDLIAGTIFIIGGITTIMGMINLAAVLIAVGVLIEALKMLAKYGA